MILTTDEIDKPFIVHNIKSLHFAPLSRYRYGTSRRDDFSMIRQTRKVIIMIGDFPGIQGLGRL